MYQQLVMEHAKNPRCCGPISKYDSSHEEINPLCGDKVTIYLKRSKGEPDGVLIFQEVTGCAICKASASILATSLNERSPETILSSISAFEKGVEDAATPEFSSLPSDLQSLAELREYPVRHKCLMLPWRALRRAVVGLVSSESGPG